MSVGFVDRAGRFSNLLPVGQWLVQSQGIDSLETPRWTWVSITTNEPFFTLLCLHPPGLLLPQLGLPPGTANPIPTAARGVAFLRGFWASDLLSCLRREEVGGEGLGVVSGSYNQRVLSWCQEQAGIPWTHAEPGCTWDGLHHTQRLGRLGRQAQSCPHPIISHPIAENMHTCS